MLNMSLNSNWQPDGNSALGIIFVSGAVSYKLSSHFLLDKANLCASDHVQLHKFLDATPCHCVFLLLGF